MAVSNQEIAGLFYDLENLTKIEDGNPQSFRARAYGSAAKTIENLSEAVADMSESDLVAIKGIGKSSAKKIREIVETGSLGKIDELRATYPPEFLELVRVPGLGPKTAVLIRDQLGVQNVDDLRQAIADQALRDLPGLGAKTEEKLATAIERLGMGGKDRRTPILDGMAQALRVMRELESLEVVDRIQYCGSLRRFRETIADVDILVASTSPSVVMDRFRELTAVKEVIGSGETKTSVVLQSGLQVDVRVVEPDQFGAATLYFTGSKDHNIRLRQLAIAKGWLLNEYGLIENETDEVVASRTEEEIYEKLDLPWIPPTIREDIGEIEAGLDDALPDLVEDEHILGDLHVHSDMSGDGDDSLEDMLDTAAARGLAYIAITDHAEDLSINGSTREEMLEQRAHLATLQDRYPTMRLLHGTELNIGPDGGLDYDHDFLMGYDWCVASVHSHFDLSVEDQTARVVAAMEHPAVNVIGHLTGRRIGKRPGIEVDLETVLDAAERTGTAIEINSHLDRLDASSDVLRRAMDRDVTFVISTDAHRTSELAQIRWGVLNAQRGWVTRDRVANTWDRDRFVDWAARTRA